MKAFTAVLAMSVLLVLGGSGIALADPQIITFDVTCADGETFTATSILNNQAEVGFVDGWVAGGSTSVGILESATSSTLGPLFGPPPGFNQNNVPLTTCTFVVPGVPGLGTITAQILMTPVGSH